MVKPLYTGLDTKLTPLQNAQNYLTPVNAVNMSVFVNGITEKKDGSNITVVQFVDTNKNGKLDKDDVVNYTDKGEKKQSTIVDEKEVGDAQISATNIMLKDGGILKASKQNMFKASSLLNLKENNMTPDGTTLLVDTKLSPEEQFNAVNRLNDDCERILRRGNGGSGELVTELSNSTDGKKHLQDAPISHSENKTNGIVEEPKDSKSKNKNMLNLLGLKEYIVNPAAIEITQPLTSSDLNKPDWNKGLGIGYYTRLKDNK